MTTKEGSERERVEYGVDTSKRFLETIHVFDRRERMASRTGSSRGVQGTLSRGRSDMDDFTIAKIHEARRYWLLDAGHARRKDEIVLDSSSPRTMQCGLATEEVTVTCISGYLE